MKTQLYALWTILISSIRDLLPLIIVISFFQFIVLQQPIPELGKILGGLCMVLFGLTLFIHGLEMGLFPIGETMAYAFARKGNAFWLLIFAFALGFGTTIAEPALIAVADEAAKIAADAEIIQKSAEARADYSLGIRLTVALSVGFAISLGVLRILLNWPIQYLITGGYMAVVIITFFAPKEIIGLAYDSGGVTTSTITVPLVTALGIGLSHSIKGRNPMIDGFGLIALASLLPIFFVMLFGILYDT